MKRSTSRGLALAFLSVLLLAGCATTKSAGDNGRPDVLTREQIMGVEGATSLYDVVRRLRPRWLVARAENRSLGGTANEIAVYQGQTYLGGIDTLRQLQPGMAYQLRWLDGPTATSTLPGLGSGRTVAGAIVMDTRAPGGS